MKTTRQHKTNDPGALVDALISAGVEFRRTAGGSWLAYGLNGEGVSADLRERFFESNERALAGTLVEIEGKQHGIKNGYKRRSDK